MGSQPELFKSPQKVELMALTVHRFRNRHWLGTWHLFRETHLGDAAAGGAPANSSNRKTAESTEATEGKVSGALRGRSRAMVCVEVALLSGHAVRLEVAADLRVHELKWRAQQQLGLQLQSLAARFGSAQVGSGHGRSPGLRSIELKDGLFP